VSQALPSCSLLPDHAQIVRRYDDAQRCWNRKLSRVFTDISPGIPRFVLLSVAIVVIGVWLASLGNQIAATAGAVLCPPARCDDLTARGRIAGSYPTVDLAVSNLFGSNIFNLAIGSTTWCISRPWSNLSQVHIFVAMVMTSVAIVGLIYAARPHDLHKLGWLALIVLYIGGCMLSIEKEAIVAAALRGAQFHQL